MYLKKIVLTQVLNPKKKTIWCEKNHTIKKSKKISIYMRRWVAVPAKSFIWAFQKNAKNWLWLKFKR